MAFNTELPPPALPAPLPVLETPRWQRVLRWVGVICFIAGSMAFGAGLYLTHKFSGQRGFNPIRTALTMADYAQLAFNPEKAFPGRRRLNLLCMGLDRNWTRRNMPYTKGARTDTMMVVSLDLEDRTVHVLSIPRDMHVHMPDTRFESKINDAHTRGGVPYTVRTVEEFLEIDIDHFVVIKQEAIQGAIDKVGGLDLKVEKQMDYDDNWGHLHIHLKPGLQHLTGEQVVGYMRFRADAEGDFGRIRRQQQVVQILSERMKDPMIIFRMGELFDVLNEYVQTDLKRDQILALGRMFHHVQQQDLLTASVPGEAVNRPNNAYLEPDREKTALLVDWLVRGHEDAANRLISVRVINESGTRRLGDRTAAWLRAVGFRAWTSPPVRGLGTSGGRGNTSEAIDYGTLPRAGRRVLSSLGIAGRVTKATSRRPGSGDVTLIVGGDLVASELLARQELLERSESTAAAPRRRRNADAEFEKSLRDQGGWFPEPEGAKRRNSESRSEPSPETPDRPEQDPSDSPDEPL